VARAKRTQRADARRRHRAALAAADPIDEDIEGATPRASTTRSSGSSSARPSSGDKAIPAGRMGFGEAFRASIRPLHVRADLASLPWIAIHTKALWVPVLVTIGSTVAVVATQGGSISLFLLAYFIQTPAIGSVFIAGFLAPRASWLLGVIVGLVAAACYSVLVIGFSPSLGAVPPTTEQAQAVVVEAFLLSPIMGGFFAAGAAWYRRFLAYSSPNRGRSSQNQKPTARQGDGRTRSGTNSQKAGAKR
jgi:hypothetical protein